MERERRSFQLYSQFYERMLQQETQLLCQREQVRAVCERITQQTAHIMGRSSSDVIDELSWYSPLHKFTYYALFTFPNLGFKESEARSDTQLSQRFTTDVGVLPWDDAGDLCAAGSGGTPGR